MKGERSDGLLADRYSVDWPIARGRSTVYRGTDTRLHRAVALKEVKLASGHESLDRVRHRALREARAAARLHNPSVVTVFDVIEEDESIWLVMELVDAPSLAQLVDGTVADWQAQAERFASSHDAYEEIGIAAADYRDYNAALWEFRYTDDRTRYHAADLGFVADDRGYALYFHTADTDWAAAQPLFRQFKESFQPTG